LARATAAASKSMPVGDQPKARRDQEVAIAAADVEHAAGRHPLQEEQVRREQPPPPEEDPREQGLDAALLRRGDGREVRVLRARPVRVVIRVEFADLVGPRLGIDPGKPARGLLAAPQAPASGRAENGIAQRLMDHGACRAAAIARQCRLAQHALIVDHRSPPGAAIMRN